MLEKLVNTSNEKFTSSLQTDGETTRICSTRLDLIVFAIAQQASERLLLILEKSGQRQKSAFVPIRESLLGIIL